MLRHSKLMFENFEPNLSMMTIKRAALLNLYIFLYINLLSFFLVSVPSLLPTLAERRGNSLECSLESKGFASWSLSD